MDSGTSTVAADRATPIASASEHCLTSMVNLRFGSSRYAAPDLGACYVTTSTRSASGRGAWLDLRPVSRSLPLQLVRYALM